MTDTPRRRVRSFVPPAVATPDPDNVTAPADYEVGYGRPPLATRFKLGNRANPKGRPKGKKDPATILLEKLGAKIVVTDEGRKKKMSKLEVGATMLANRFAKGGDRRDFAVIFQALGGKSGQIQGASSSASADTDGDGVVPIEERDAILDWYVAARMAEAGSDEVVPEPSEGAAS